MWFYYITHCLISGHDMTARHLNYLKSCIPRTSRDCCAGSGRAPSIKRRWCEVSLLFFGNNYNFLCFSAVLMAECVKFIICTGLVMQESGSMKRGALSIYSTVILNLQDTLRVCVPSFLYIVQNNLLYVSASNLDAATYQVNFNVIIP